MTSKKLTNKSITSYSIPKALKILLINIVVFFVLLEITSRIFLCLRRDSSFVDPSSTSLFYYPEMKSTTVSPPSSSKWDILLLGASVLHPAWGSVEKELKILLSNSIKNVKIHNVAIESHTTRDSLLKYRLLEGHVFDKVFVYHGINDLRMNNYPEDRFQQDYSHVHWYRTVNPLVRHRELSFLATPFMVEHAWFKLTRKDDDEQYEHRKYGGLIKTEQAFHSNLKAISNLAEKRGDALVLATYAYHVPPNYSKDAFYAKNLDYNAHRLPVEAWGHPKNIRIGLELHNKIIRRLASEEKITFVEIADHIHGEAANFDDVCHLTSKGSRRFAQLLASHLAPTPSTTE